MAYKSTFKCTIMTPDALLYENEVQSLFLCGDHGEYELLPYHYPILGVILQSNIIVDWKESVPVNFGIVRFFANDCIILVEQAEDKRAKDKPDKKEEEDISISEEKQMDREMR